MESKKQLAKHIYYYQSRLSIGNPSQSIPEGSIKVKDKEELEKCIRNFLDKKYPLDVIVHGYSPSQIYEDMLSFFSFLPAAGGVVRNDANEYLFIKRFGIWDLPKGKIHQGESAEKGAMREVAEETGIHGLNITGRLPSSYHVYRQDEIYILKETKWFFMHTKGRGKLTPQKEEDITSAVWLKKEQASAALAGSYRSLAETLSDWFRD